MTSQRGDSTLACIVNKEKSVAKEWFGVAWLQEAPIRVSHTQACFDFRRDAQAKKGVGIANKKDNCRDVCVVQLTTTEYDTSY